MEDKVTYDWLILLIAKTGIRFSEALALTKADFDFSNQTISISKTWNYKHKDGGYESTKNRSSTRIIPIDWQLSIQFYQLLKSIDSYEKIFVCKRVFNSTVNQFLKRKCIAANIPEITVHGLRHTHAFLLLFANISVASVAKRLGH